MDPHDLRYRLYRLGHACPTDALERAAVDLVCSAVTPEGGPVVVGEGRFLALVRALEERGRQG